MDIFSFPLSVILSLSFCILVFITDRRQRSSETIALMAVCAVITAVEGIWKLDLQHGVILWLPVLAMMYICAQATKEAFRHKRYFSFRTVHLGFTLVLFGAFFGAPDCTEANIVVRRDDYSHYATGSDGLRISLDFNLRLRDFRIDYYDDLCSPKQYTSTIEIEGDGECREVRVNHPCLYKGWLIYQSDYDHERESFSVLKLVRDPWLPITFAGMALLALGAVLGLRGTWRSRAVIPVALALAVVFGFVSMARIRLGTLAPALRSLWFVPHLIVYMLAYSVLAIALIVGLVTLFARKNLDQLVEKLLSTASALLITGMLCGAAWAKIAWGDYWTWDPKECWAAVTWLITLTGTHLIASNFQGCNFDGRRKLTIIVLIVLTAFLAMQVTWYGVNWLPSAQYSMHAYNG